MYRLQNEHVQALIDAINDAEMHADALVDPENLEDQAEKLSQILEVVREIVRSNNNGG